MTLIDFNASLRNTLNCILLHFDTTEDIHLVNFSSLKERLVSYGYTNIKECPLEETIELSKNACLVIGSLFERVGVAESLSILDSLRERHIRTIFLVPWRKTVKQVPKEAAQHIRDRSDIHSVYKDLTVFMEGKKVGVYTLNMTKAPDSKLDTSELENPAKPYRSKSVTVVIPFRDSDCPYRSRNLRVVTSYYTKIFPRGEVVVAYSGNTPVAVKGVIYVEVPALDGDGGFRKGYHANVGVSVSSGRFIVIADADLIVHPSGFKGLTSLNNKQFLNPSNKYCLLSEDRVNEFLRIGKIPEGYRGRGKGPMHGGVICFTRSGYKNIAGFMPWFQGWGSEDTELPARAKRLGIERIVNSSHQALHLYHPPSRRSGGSPLANKRWAKYLRGLSVEDLSDFIDRLKTYSSSPSSLKELEDMHNSPFKNNKPYSLDIPIYRGDTLDG